MRPYRLEHAFNDISPIYPPNNVILFNHHDDHSLLLIRIHLNSSILRPTTNNISIPIQGINFNRNFSNPIVNNNQASIKDHEPGHIPRTIIKSNQITYMFDIHPDDITIAS